MGKVLGGTGFGKGPRKPATAPHKVRVSKPLPPTPHTPKPPPAPDVPQGIRLGLTDRDNAARLALAWKGKIAFASTVRWMKWAGSHWKVLADAEALQLTHKPNDRLAADFASLPQEDRISFARWVVLSNQIPSMHKTLEAAEGIAALRVDVEKLDADPYMLATPSGTVNLKTGELVDPDPQHWNTLCTTVPFEERADCPKWKAYIAERLKGHMEMVGYVQRALGQGLIGYTGPHMFLLHGPTHCGKTTTLEVVMRVLGTYAATMPVGVLMTNNKPGESPAPFLVSLRGVRFIKASESKATDRLESHVIKLLTGSDRITIRDLHAKPFSMLPKFTVFLCTNHAPAVDDPGAAMWNRLRLIPFETGHPGHDETYIKRLADEEGPGILGWLVRGAKEAIARGLKEPLTVQTKTGEYREANDPLLEWLKVRCRQKEGAIGVGLRRDYVVWCQEAGYQSIGDKAWAEAMRQRFHRHPVRQESGFAYIGVALKSPTPDSKRKVKP